MFPINVCISINQKQIPNWQKSRLHLTSPPQVTLANPLRQRPHFHLTSAQTSGNEANPALGFQVSTGVLISFLKQNNICNIVSTIPLVRARHPGTDWSLVSNPEAYTKEYHLLTFLLVVLVSYIPFTPGATLWSNNPAMRLLPVAGINPWQTLSNNWSHSNSLQIHCRDTV